MDMIIVSTKALMDTIVDAGVGTSAERRRL
jgi:hypothetical protein